MFLFIKKYISTQVKHTILHLKSELFESHVMIQVVAISALQHVSVFQDSVVIIPTSSACFNPFKSGLISYKVTKINQI